MQVDVRLYGGTVVLPLEDYNELLKKIDRANTAVRLAQDQAEDAINELARIRRTCIIRPRMDHEMEDLE